MPQFSHDEICYRFRYSKEDFDLVVGFLKSNNYDVSKTFDCVWSDPMFAGLPKIAAAEVLYFVDNINRVGRDKGFDGLWDLICNSEKLCQPQH